MYEITCKFCCLVENTRVYVDSQISELHKILQKQVNKTLRGLLVNKHIYIWPSREATHHQVIKQLIADEKISASDKLILIKLHYADPGIEIFTYGHHIKDIVHNPIVQHIVRLDPKNNIIMEM